jgi:hypothetical protein
MDPQKLRGRHYRNGEKRLKLEASGYRSSFTLEAFTRHGGAVGLEV